MLDIVRTEKKLCAWDTASERAWLRTIGESAKDNEHYHTFDREAALRGYIEAAYKRVDWGNIDRDRCIEYARALLAGVV